MLQEPFILLYFILFHFTSLATLPDATESRRLGWRVQEMKELAALAYRDTTSENREFWKNEMGQALREIQDVYDDKLESMRSEMETFYNLKVSYCALLIIIIIIIIIMADSYVAVAAHEAGSAAEEAATRKTAKYSSIQAHHIFQPVAVESLHGPVNASGRVFLSKLGRKLADQSDDDREITSYFSDSPF